MVSGKAPGTSAGAVTRWTRRPSRVAAGSGQFQFMFCAAEIGKQNANRARLPVSGAPVGGAAGGSQSGGIRLPWRSDPDRADAVHCGAFWGGVRIPARGPGAGAGEFRESHRDAVLTPRLRSRTGASREGNRPETSAKGKSGSNAHRRGPEDDPWPATGFAGNPPGLIRAR